MTRERPVLRFRHPVEHDHLATVRLLEAWWEPKQARATLQRHWFRHFAATCWLAETADGRTAALVVGFVSQERPEAARLHLVAVDPNLRRAGVGRELVARFAASAQERGAQRLEAVVWAGDRSAIDFLRAVGFVPIEPEGGSRIYGTPAFADYDHDADDMAVLTLDVEGPGPIGG
jgi:ribosomal protein S18 acetylase RimI-like enzyme